MLNKILILRKTGGLGDILVHRMLFEDIKRFAHHVTFACPKPYHEAVVDHPFIDSVVDIDIDKSKYDKFYDTSHVCNRYEMRTAPFVDKHRSDIWAEHCGFVLNSHNMHIRLSDEEKAAGERHKDSIVFAPVSAMSGKSLDVKQIQGVVDRLSNVVILHNKPLPINCKQVSGNIRQWMSIIAGAKLVVSVDTAAFHCAGGLGKPLVGIFSFTDGKVVGKYYDFTLVQRHRDDGCWDCGPCHNFMKCPKTEVKFLRKPCISELQPDEIVAAVNQKLFG